ncbi:alkaline phosphatase family protein [Pedobacter sp. KR3-3]|uniref:Alkaline phosphatase family protein n=1 Tax=Pedobacter albus TaxID=3113905 RepID=A0ABU7I5P7_9SPHI|nr:alkaline phosphatase family protein [Pedobacter sp. KR3-3]MEE1944787.1 alkaline phosphatase family protein [Pedobacter sp. KR3-3]
MKKIYYAVLVALTTLSFTAVAQKRVLIIGLDGFSAEGFKAIKHPNIDKMVADGVLSLTTRPVMPSVTLPNWTSHLTGSGPEEHGVTSNSWTVQKHELQAIETDQEGYYPSIFKVLKEKVPNVKIGYYYNWAELINSINRKYLDEVSFEANDGYASNYQKAFDFVVKHKNEPTLVFLYNVSTDHAGHKYKWMSPEYVKAVEEADVAIGALLDKLRDAKLYSGTHFILMTDHGGIGNGHGGTSMNEMQVPWAITGPQIKKRGLMTEPNSNKNTALVIAHIFGCKDLPKSWTGVVPRSIFK